MPSAELLYKIARYLISGMLGALINLSSLYVFVEYGDIYYLTASVLAFLVALVFGFMLQKHWTFRDRSYGARVQLMRYAIVATLNLGVNTACMYLFVEGFGIWYLFSQILTGVVTAVTGYVGYQRFVFSSASEPMRSVS